MNWTVIGCTNIDVHEPDEPKKGPTKEKYECIRLSDYYAFRKLKSLTAALLITNLKAIKAYLHFRVHIHARQGVARNTV